MTGPLKRRQLVNLVATFGILITPAWAQDADQETEGHSGRRPARMLRSFRLQPEEMHERLAERYLAHFERAYELSDEQREKINNYLTDLKEAQKTYDQERREEFEKLRSRMEELHARRQQGDEIDREAMRDLVSRMRELRVNSPMLDFRKIRGQVEEMLPPEQVEAAREQQEERRARFRTRRFEHRMRPGSLTDPWDRYVDRFIRQYELDDAQQSTAKSLLRSYKQERDTIRTKNQEKYAQIPQMEDTEARPAVWRELNEPVERLFDEFVGKLEQIPTLAQKEAVEAEMERRRARTRPAASTTRPATTTSRPADQ